MNVFITGGTSGMGEEFALHYHQLGYKVAVCSHEAKEFPASKLAQHKSIEFFQADVTNLVELRAAVASFVKRHGPLDLMLANAGISYQTKKYFPDVMESRRIIEVNVLGVINTFEAALDSMRPCGRGQIMAMSSMAAHNGLPGRSAYCASKSAVLKWCESMAAELSTIGVTVSCVLPGFIKTQLTVRNKHKMPFALNCQDAVKLITRGIEKKQFLITFPWPLAIVMRLLSFLPRSWYVSLMKFSSKWLQDKKV
jgi:NAD(P)-dependent dehydrogenase (short-subunit alcohol dehydrogenase family)